MNYSCLGRLPRLTPQKLRITVLESEGPNLVPSSSSNTVVYYGNARGEADPSSPP